MREPAERRWVPAAITSVLLSSFALACQDKASLAQLEEYRAQAALEEQNRDVVTRVFDGLNRQDETLYQELCAPDYGWYFPANSPKKLTREEEAGFVKLLWAAFPDIHWEIEEMIARGDRIVARFTARGTHEAEYPLFPQSGGGSFGGSLTLPTFAGDKVPCRCRWPQRADLTGVRHLPGRALLGTE